MCPLLSCAQPCQCVLAGTSRQIDQRSSSADNWNHFGLVHLFWNRALPRVSRMFPNLIFQESAPTHWFFVFWSGNQALSACCPHFSDPIFQKCHAAAAARSQFSINTKHLVRNLEVLELNFLWWIFPTSRGIRRSSDVPLTAHQLVRSLRQFENNSLFAQLSHRELPKTEGMRGT